MKILSLFSLLFFIASCQAPRPTNLGLNDKDQLSPCPDKPNCVNSHYQADEAHFMEPLKYQLSQQQAYERMIRLLEKTDNAKIVTKKPEYIHAEFTSSLFRFVDDVEFNFTQDSLIHFRSASRVGHSDLGANKKRISDLTFRFYQNDM